MSEHNLSLSENVDPSYDPTEGHLEATEFPPDDVPDPEQTPEDLGAEDDTDEEVES